YFEKKKEFFAEFNKDYPILSKLFLPFQIIEGIDDGILKFVKDMTIGLVSDIFGFLKYEIEGLMTDPSGTLEENLDFIMKIGAIINPVTKEQYKIQEDFFNSIWESIKKSIDTEVVNGNPYSALKFVTDVVMNVASLFVGAGEIKELSALKKFGIILNE
ncbi:hypothetical protein, partial [Clostridium sp. HBUAS56017]|uniref:hypothetical protein n=1 Tax=Clostridium sp. HBUAS56017 TaxID=2571128 RepID=UPI001A9AF5D0